jgi:hypothetical protein
MQPAELLKEMSTIKIGLSVIRYISSLCCVLASSRFLHLSDGVLSSNPSYKSFFLLDISAPIRGTSASFTAKDIRK